MSDFLRAALGRLPHGPEFRFLDRLVSLVPGKEGVGTYRVHGDVPFLRGHFPGDPILPGVLLLEAVAQLAGVVAQSDPAIPPLADLRLTAVRGAKILGSARPGQDVRLEVWITGRLGGLIQARGRASVDAQEVLVTELTFTGKPPTGMTL